MTQKYPSEAWQRACRESLLRSQARRAEPTPMLPRDILTAIVAGATIAIVVAALWLFLIASWAIS